MHEPLSEAKRKKLEAEHPVTLSQKEKLKMWADAIRAYQGGYPRLANNLEGYVEYCKIHPDYKPAFNDLHWIGSPMAIAYNTTAIRDAGLKGATIKDAKDFFEIKDEDFHAFSCNCGGAILNSDMANRIERLAR